MEKRTLKEGATPFTPYTTTSCIKPDIDETYTEYSYSGELLSIVQAHKCGFKLWQSMIGSLQGMAIYGNIMVRMANGGTHYILGFNEQSYEIKGTFSTSTGHSNSLQFAPTILSGETYPLLYVAGLSGKCYVIQISQDFSVSLIQTLTIDESSSISQTCNLQIGDDGHIWAAYLDSTDQFHFVKLRKVLTSEGNVTITDNDIIDQWSTEELYPYSNHVWQGMKVKFGKIWLLFGTTGPAQYRGIQVFDTATHRNLSSIDLSVAASVEFEDLDFYGDSLLVASYTAQIYKIRF